MGLKLHLAVTCIIFTPLLDGFVFSPTRIRHRQLFPLIPAPQLRSTKVAPEAIINQLRDRLERNDTSQITVEGYVIAKRSLGKPLVFVDVVSSDGDPYQALLRKEYYHGSHYDGHRKCLLKGSKLSFTGIASPTRNPGEVVLLIQDMRLLALPRQQQLIRSILVLALNNEIPRNQIGDDVSFDVPESKTIQIWAKQLAKSILSNLPEDTHYPSEVDEKQNSKRGHTALQEAPKDWKELVTKTASEYIDDVIDCDSIETAQQTESKSVSVMAWVQNRRRFTNNITQLHLVDDLTLLRDDKSPVRIVDYSRLVCLMHPDQLQNAGLYGNILAVGAKVWVKGYLADGQTLCVTDIRLVQSSSRSVTIRFLLDLLFRGEMDAEEVSEALLMPYQDALDIQSSSATERRWKANQLAANLQKIRKQTTVAPELLEVLEKYKHIADDNPVVSKSVTHNNDPEIIPKGVSGSTWQSKKKPQLEWMKQEILSVLCSHPDFGRRRLVILDIGGGKGSLANYLGLAIEAVEIKVVDIAAGAVANGQMRAKRWNTPVEFQVADASTDLDIQADVVVALHACGHLSDIALAHAVQRKAGFVICPCCFCSNPQLTIPGSGQRVSEWVGLPETDWSALKLLAEIQGDIPLASKAIATVCGIRADAARKKLPKGRWVQVRSFPIQYSTRNTVIVGSCS